MKKFDISLATENKSATEWVFWTRNYCKWTNPRPLSKEEYIALRDAVSNYEPVAQEFFYKMLKPMVSGLAYQVLRVYKVVVKPVDLSTTIYREFWDGGKFTRLTSYSGDSCSLFSWVALGAAQIVYSELEELGVIKKSKEKTAKNTNLRLKSIANKDELKAVLELVTEPCWHDILTEIYVKRTSPEEIMKKFEMDEITLTKTIKVAETVLKEQLIAANTVVWHRPNSKKSKKSTVVNLVSIALSDVSGNLNTTTSSDALEVAMSKFDDDNIYEEVQEVLQLMYPDMTPQEMWDRFVKDQALLCGMTNDQLDVWTARYIDREEPVSIAKRLDMKRSNVDNIYSRANKVLIDHLRNWWKKNS